MATLMSNSLAVFSTTSSASKLGAATMSGMPASLAYSKSLRTCASSFFCHVMVPPPMIVKPAASVFARAALMASGGSVRARCTSLKLMYLTSHALAISRAFSNGNLRKEYEATPSFNCSGAAAAGAAPARPVTWGRRLAAATVVKNSRRLMDVLREGV